MKRQNKLKFAIISAILSLVVCISMFAGTTFAWFTDSVTSSNNVIKAGNLDIVAEYLDENGNWKDLTSTSSVFEEDALWEPGHTEVVYLRILNNGTLSFKYSLKVNIANEIGSINVQGNPFMLSDYIQMGVIKGVDSAFDTREEAIGAAGTTSVIASGYAEQGIMNAGAQPIYVAFVVYMPETVGNEANYRNGENAPEIDLGIYLQATQTSNESDSFGSDYDDGLSFPSTENYFEVSAPVAGVSADNVLTSPISVGSVNSVMNAQVPAGVKLDSGVSELKLAVKSNIETEANLSLVDGQARRSFDVHINGIAEDNTVPMTISLGAVLPTGLKDSSVELYHVEGSNTVKMELVKGAFTAHNQFTYDSESGEVVLYIAGFSEVTAVVALSNPWNGGVDTTWYINNENATEYTLTTPEQLAGLGELVSNEVTFEGKTIKLGADLDLGGVDSQYVFYPIGYKSETPSVLYEFKGTFDGQGHTIADLYQTTWNIEGNYDGTYYNRSLGLFAFLEGATVKNLVIENFLLEGEFAPTGCIAGRARGANFENITLHKNTPSTYNWGVAGIIGIDQGGENVVYNFDNINIDSTNTIVALWGSWDVGCASLIGQIDDTTKVNVSNSVLAPVLDVYNDVCGNYQYYQYRYAGMIIGTIGGDSEPDKENLTCNNVTVYYGDWADYYYCEFEKNSGASYTEDFQFSRVDEKDIVFDLQGNAISCTHNHTDNEDKLACYLPFNQLYTGYGWGANPYSSHAGVKVVNRYAYTVTYMSGTRVSRVDYIEYNEDGSIPAHTLATPQSGYKLVDNSGAEVKVIAAGNDSNVVVYLTQTTSNKKYIARFVNHLGETIYEEEFTKGASTINAVPAVPSVPGYNGQWENYSDKLKNATSDIVINPIYTLFEDGSYKVIGEEVTPSQAFEFLEAGGNLIMAGDLAATVSSKANGPMCDLTVKEGVSESRIDLNSFDLSYTAGHNGNAEWTLFRIGAGYTFTIGAGINGSGNLIFTLQNIHNKVTPCVFDIVEGGTLVLERGIVIEIRSVKEKISLVQGINGFNPDDYAGFNVQTGTDGEYNYIRIIVTGTTTITNKPAAANN